MDANAIKTMIPWWLRIGAKIVLSRLPLGYAAWKRLKLFEHGDMNQPQRALDIFLGHAQTAGVLTPEGETLRFTICDEGVSVLELGPGDSLFSAVIANALGAARTVLIDAGAFASTDMDAYKSLIDLLRQKKIMPALSAVPETIEELMAAFHGRYLTEGVSSLAELPTNSVDYCFSNAVLEHIPRKEFDWLVRELFRVMKPGGVSVHRVDLKDHLGGGMNNLRFSDKIWESAFFRNSGFYTNRLRFKEMVAKFEAAGFSCRLPRVVRWEQLPIPRNALNGWYQSLDEDDLLVNGFDLVLHRIGN